MRETVALSSGRTDPFAVHAAADVRRGPAAYGSGAESAGADGVRAARPPAERHRPRRPDGPTAVGFSAMVPGTTFRFLNTDGKNDKREKIRFYNTLFIIDDARAPQSYDGAQYIMRCITKSRLRLIIIYYYYCYY